jgi:dipeptidyl aminopeptidase/acylaminoacyl peptidase
VVGDATPGPGRDLYAGIGAVKALGSVDPARVALTGYSYGGVMTAWMIGHHRDWCAAIAGGVVVDFRGYYDQSDTGIWIGSLLGSPHLAGNREKYLEQSPTTFLAGATTPTLIMQNVGDDNAPVAQAYEMFHALKDNGVNARLVTYDVEGHDPHDPYRERQMFERTLAWMSANCTPGHP